MRSRSHSHKPGHIYPAIYVSDANEDKLQVVGILRGRIAAHESALNISFHIFNVVFLLIFFFFNFGNYVSRLLQF